MVVPGTAFAGHLGLGFGLYEQFSRSFDQFSRLSPNIGYISNELKAETAKSLQLFSFSVKSTRSCRFKSSSPRHRTYIRSRLDPSCSRDDTHFSPRFGNQKSPRAKGVPLVRGEFLALLLLEGPPLFLAPLGRQTTSALAAPPPHPPKPHRDPISPCPPDEWDLRRQERIVLHAIRPFGKDLADFRLYLERNKGPNR